MNLLQALSRPRDDHARSDRVYGAVVGVVTSLADPDSLGRVKVQFPWLKPDDESRWARIASLMAGPSRGAVFRPEVDDEVLVVFEQGDTRFPYVIGALWNGKDAMPTERGSEAGNDVRLIKSRSGHVLIFDDTQGKEKLTVKDKAGNKVELSSAGVVITSKAIKVGGGASEGLVLGDAFMKLFNMHTHATGVGPSSPPTQQMAKGQHVSNKHKVE